MSKKHPPGTDFPPCMDFQQALGNALLRDLLVNSPGLPFGSETSAVPSVSTHRSESLTLLGSPSKAANSFLTSTQLVQRCSSKFLGFFFSKIIPCLRFQTSKSKASHLKSLSVSTQKANVAFRAAPALCSLHSFRELRAGCWYLGAKGGFRAGS